ncbi:hypothetical protein ACEQ8H_004213 [Pleosporales sp. CAS-2024a]
MCKYWKKQHTCGHSSDRPYIEMCRSGCLSNMVCADIAVDETARKSHFPCYPCIKTEARTETEADTRAQHEAVEKAKQARETALSEKHAAELRAKEERVRRDACEKAAREREEEKRTKAMKQQEEERAKKEGGVWIQTGSGKKTKGRRGAGVGALGFSVLPNSGQPVVQTFAEREKKENASGSKMSAKEEVKGSNMGGRAGTWGPKQILSRKDNAAISK